MEDKATPRPWKHDGEAEYIFAEQNQIVAQIRGWGYLEKTFGPIHALEIQAANAELIVKAVNYHDRLVEALEDVLPYLSATGTNGNHYVPKIESLLKELKQ